MKLEWIECNLPWYATDDRKFPPRPDFSEKEREIFGMTIEESRESISAKEYEFYTRCVANRKLKKYKNHPAIPKVLKHQELVSKICAWNDLQPEWKEDSRQRDKINEEFNKKSFSTSLLKPGTLFELEDDGGIFLIGDFFHDEYREIKNSDVVKRYAVLIDMDELKSKK